MRISPHRGAGRNGLVALCGAALICGAALSCGLALSSCRKPAQGAPSRLYLTWESLGDTAHSRPAGEVETLPPPGSKPWAGTVSHHLLANSQIEHWFSELANRRKVETFYILSPSHWGLSSQDWSLTDGAWKVAGGLVYSNTAEVRRIARDLEVPLEPGVFEPEHGISTLIPYIARYFPSARVVAMAYHGEPPLNQGLAERLTAALAPAFDSAGRQKNFLLISADFAHHGSPEGTALKDERTRLFFAKPGRETWIFAGCDNRPGIYALSRLLTADSRCAVLFHTDSFKISGMDSHDITSYFFTFFWDEKGTR